jgi:uncharacterized membrane protein YphA (DoxX/SURF4 family)
MISASPSRTVAFARIVTGILFFCEGWGKFAGTFLSGGFAKSAARMAKEGYPFWRPFLERVVMVHPTPFAWAIAAGEVAIGLSLLTGFLVRWACAGGIAMMLAIGFGDSWASPGSPWSRYVTEWLEQVAFMLLFLIFATSDAGRLWGLDARRRRSR